MKYLDEKLWVSRRKEKKKISSSSTLSLQYFSHLFKALQPCYYVTNPSLGCRLCVHNMQYINMQHKDAILGPDQSFSSTSGEQVKPQKENMRLLALIQ